MIITGGTDRPLLPDGDTIRIRDSTSIGGDDCMTVHCETLSNGLRVLIEPMPGMASAAIYWLAPAGSGYDRAGGDGTAAMLEEYLFRGAGGMSSREHSDALDLLGVQRATDVGPHHLVLSATMLSSNLFEALPLVVSMATAPTLEEEQLEAVRSLCLQSVASLRDDPQHFVMLQLRHRHLASPLNRHGYGDVADLERITIADLHAEWERRCLPDGTIIGVAGDVEPEPIARSLETLLQDWHGAAMDVEMQERPKRGIVHVEEPTAQVHLGIAFDAPAECEHTTVLERLAIAVLSGGMSGRLFTEVREKRALCYSVDAAYRTSRDYGWVSIHSGTTPERAQETLDVCIAEVERLHEGASEEEFHRATIGLKSRLVMQGESTAARAAAIARDQFRLGRARTLDEIEEEIEAVTLEQLNAYLASRNFGPYTVATLGPSELTLP